MEALDDDELYNVAKIIRTSEETGLFGYDLDTGRQLVDEDKKRAIKNARSALANFTYLRLPDPDGEI